MTSETPGWPAGQPIPEMPVDDWPNADRRALEPPRATSRNPFAGKHARQAQRGGPATWRPATLRNVVKGYGKWLSFVAAMAPGDLDQPAADRVTPARCRAFVDAMAGSGLAASSQAFHLYHLLMACRVLDRGRDWTWLAEAAANLRAAAEPVRDKRSRVLPVADIHRHGIALMERASRQSRRGLLDYRDGLILALWSARPWRVRTFAALDIKRHLAFDGETTAHVTFEAEEIKTAMARSWPVPRHLVPFVRTYLSDVRPPLPGASRHSGLWPSAKGGPLTENALARVMGRHTQRAFGVALNPHALRYSAATATALNGPHASGTVMAILGHANPRTSSDYYVMARTLEAQEKVITVVRSYDDAPNLW